ncbi:MAG: Nif3-like dinuclear metal center hexameric protein [bacterium]|nr:MAG: Nif3-like dinuclear metal center hexameric protein [bacterium]
MNTPTIAQLIRKIEESSPREIAAEGDPVGLQCGDPLHSAGRVMFSLDAGEQAVSQALEARAELLVTHHPLLFKPLSPDTLKEAAGRAFVKAVQGGLAVYSAHTNLDAAREGINASLGQLVGLTRTRVLHPLGPGQFKVVVFVPHQALEKVREAAFEAGAGRIGGYSRCSFSTPGTGTFFGEAGSAPTVGVRGRLEEVQEARLEVLVPEAVLAGVLHAVRRQHPYEEPALDVYPLMRTDSPHGMGLVGRLDRRTAVGEIAGRLSASLRVRTARLVGRPGRKVLRVAVCAGSGASLLPAVMASGAELFITGDLKYHEAREAQSGGISVLDVGHFAPERYGVVCFRERMERLFSESGWKVETLLAREQDPFVPIR